MQHFLHLAVLIMVEIQTTVTMGYKLKEEFRTDSKS
jgi:hypothetical protein